MKKSKILILIASIISLSIHYTIYESIESYKPKDKENVSINLEFKEELEGDKVSLDKIKEILEKSKKRQESIQNGSKIDKSEKFNAFVDKNEEGSEACPANRVYTGFGIAFETTLVKLGDESFKSMVSMFEGNKTFYKVRSIKKGSNVEKAGLKPGDWIESSIFNSRKLPLNTEFPFLIIKNGKKSLISVKTELICFY